MMDLKAMRHRSIPAPSSKPLFASVFLFSLSALAFEVSLTRIFSISLSYHFAFMVITVAMLGLGMSGTVLSLYKSLREVKKVPFYGVSLGLSITLSYILSNMLPFDPLRFPYDRVQFLYIFLYCILISLPFLFAGLSISTALSIRSERAGLLYASDLIGAATGSILILLLMIKLPPEKALVLIPFLAHIGSFIISRGLIRLIPLGAIVLNLALFLTPQLITLKISPYKGLEIALRHPGAEHLKTFYSPFSRIDLFKSPAIRYAPGLSLTYLDELPHQTGISIDSGDLTAVTESTNRQDIEFLSYLPSSLPYELGHKKDVLVIEPKGGLEVLLAKHYNSENIFKVESDPLMVDIVKREFHSLSPGIYDTNTWKGSGRSWLRAAGKSFDLIDIPFLGLFYPNPFGIGEDYRFTVEAFECYLKALKDEGLLSLTLFITPPPRIELRLMNTIIEASKRLEINEIEKKTAVIRTWDTVTIMIKKSPYTQDELNKIRDFLLKRRFDVVYLPDVREDETNRFVRMTKNDYFKAFKSLLKADKRGDFEKSYIFDISPVTDDSPFFYYFIDMEKIKEVYVVMGKKWQFFLEEGLIPYFLLLLMLPLGILIILLPYLSIKNIKTRDKRSIIANLLYFALIGTGYMFVEVPLIHRMILPLENPSYAFATVVTSILLWSGIGSILSERIDKSKRPYALMLLFIVIILYDYIFLSALSGQLYSLPVPLRILSIFLSLSGLGLFMGIPFPSGIKRLGEGCPEIIPWAWAVNGFFSILSPVLAMILAINRGFKSVLLIGAIAYLMASLLPRQS